MVKRLNKHTWSWRILLFLVFVTVILQVSFRSRPDWAEVAYGRCIYPVVRGVLDVIKFPVPGIYLILGGLSIWLCWLIVASMKKAGISKKVLYFGKRLGATVCVVFCWFYWIWGFNYARPNLTERMDYEIDEPDSTWLVQEIHSAIDRANTLRALPSLQYVGTLSESDVINKHVDVGEINRALEESLPEFDYELKVEPTLHFLKPDGVLLRISTAGIYWLFSGEPNVDSGVHYLKKPVTVAHELTHAHGVTSEGDCNFIAYVACVRSDDPLIQYSGHLSYLGYLMRAALRRFGRDELTQFYEVMTSEVKQDRQAIHDHHAGYKDILPAVRDAVYDSFLKTQGVRGGIKSYGEFVMLKYARDQHQQNSYENLED